MAIDAARHRQNWWLLVSSNPAYRIFELQYALNKVDCKVLVLMRHFKLSDYAEMIREMAPEIYHQSFENLELISLPQYQAHCVD